jgi:hypothetical protein
MFQIAMMQEQRRGSKFEHRSYERIIRAPREPIYMHMLKKYAMHTDLTNHQSYRV